MKRNKPLILTILDGWGFSPAVEGNAIAAARKPNYDMLLREFPNTLVHTSGPPSDLPEGQMGNSEVGHLNIGAGRVVHMDVTRIDLMIASGEFLDQPLLLDAMHHAREGRRLHIMGLCSDGGVHSQLDASVRAAADGEARRRRAGVRALLHGWPRYASAERCRFYTRDCNRRCANWASAESPPSKAATMRWIATSAGSAIERAFNAMVLGKGEKAQDAVAVMERSYEKGVTDEFIEPVTIVDSRNEPIGLIRDDDACIFFNYRADRGREMTEALTSETLEVPSRSLVPKNLKFATMTQYDKSAEGAVRADQGTAQQHSGECVRAAALEESAGGGDGEVCARDLLLQRRH